MRIKISYKISGGFLAVLILLSLVAYLAIAGIQNVENEFTAITQKRLSTTADIQGMRYLKIPIIAEDLGGSWGRKLYFFSQTRDVFLKRISPAEKVI